MSSNSKRKHQISTRLEDYLEHIYESIKENGIATVSDIARRKKVKMPSVNSAVAKLTKTGYVTHDSYQTINLTPIGAKYCRNLDFKHRTVSAFLSEVLGVDRKIAEKDACIAEHYLHSKTIEKIVKYMQKLRIRKV